MGRDLRPTVWAEDTASANALRSDCGKEPEKQLRGWVVRLKHSERWAGGSARKAYIIQGLVGIWISFSL